jgi:hypothetical protein
MAKLERESFRRGITIAAVGALPIALLVWLVFTDENRKKLAPSVLSFLCSIWASATSPFRALAHWLAATISVSRGQCVIWFALGLSVYWLGRLIARVRAEGHPLSDDESGGHGRIALPLIPSRPRAQHRRG